MPQSRVHGGGLARVCVCVWGGGGGAIVEDTSTPYHTSNLVPVLNVHFQCKHLFQATKPTNTTNISEQRNGRKFNVKTFSCKTVECL